MKFQPTNTRTALKGRINRIVQFLSVRLESIKEVRAGRAAALEDYFEEKRKLAQAITNVRADLADAIELQAEAAAGARDHVIAAEGDVERAADEVKRAQDALALAESVLEDAHDEVRKAAMTREEVESAAARRQRTLKNEISALEQRWLPRRRAWSDRLARFQDGMTRRKRTELLKLERRLAEKEAKAAKRAGKNPLTASDIGLGKLPEEMEARVTETKDDKHA